MMQKYNHFSISLFHKKHQYFHNKNKSDPLADLLLAHNAFRKEYNL